MRANFGRPYSVFCFFTLLAGVLPVGIGWAIAREIPGLATVMRQGVPFQALAGYQQVTAVAGGYVVKPTYMLLSLVLILYLWPRKAVELQCLHTGLVFFLAGEAFCAVNYIFYHEDSAFLEYLHSFGMVLGMAFILLAFIEGLDRRVIRFTDPGEKCALLGLCEGCSKYKAIACRLRRLFQFLLPALITVAAIPLTAAMHAVSYNTTIFGTLYNYSHALIHQLYEIRFCPWAAILSLTASLFVLLIRKEKGFGAAKLLFVLGMGHLSFSLLRMVLLDSFQSDMVWFVFWEEVTELVLVLGIGFVLLLFRGKGWHDQPVRPAGG